MPPYGACLLGSINLASLIDQPFANSAAVDEAALGRRVAIAVRLLDNIIDISHYPLKAQAKEARAKRRIGLGITGLADALIFEGLKLRFTTLDGKGPPIGWLSFKTPPTAPAPSWRTRRVPFHCSTAHAFLARPNVQRLDARGARGNQRMHGIRNGCLTSIAPTGTISLLAGNVSSGIEPVFGFSYKRRVLGDDGMPHEEVVQDFAYATYMRRFAKARLRADAGRVCRGQPADARRASRHAGRAATLCRQRHFKDHQLPGGAAVRSVSRHLCRSLCARPKRLHDLPAQRDHRRRFDS